MKVYKGMGKDMKCLGFQYEIGGEYTEPEANLCHKGFHGCENALDAFTYYAPGESRYVEAELDEVSNQREDDSKVCGKRIKIGSEIGLKGIIQAGLRFIFERAESSDNGKATTGDRAHAVTTDPQAHAATTGDWAHAATTGDRAHAATTGDWAHAATTGDRAHAATTGFQAHAVTTGPQAHAVTTDPQAHAATTGFQAHAATTGFQAHAVTTGFQAHAVTTGPRAHAVTASDWAHAEVQGKNAIAATLGIRGRARGALGCYIICAEWAMDEKQDYQLIGVQSAKVDGKNILPDTWYMLKNGKFTEIKEANQ